MARLSRGWAYSGLATVESNPVTVHVEVGKVRRGVETTCALVGALFELLEKLFIFFLYISKYFHANAILIGAFCPLESVYYEPIFMVVAFVSPMAV